MAHDVPEPACRTRVLSAGPLGGVSQCADCGQIHLTLAYLTLRLQPEAFRELTGMLALALQQLSAPVSAAPAPSSLPLH